MCSECSICLEHIDDKDKLILDCKHNYHVDCIKNLFKHELNNGTKNIVSCPCCRTDINNTSNEDINNMINELKEKIILVPSPYPLLYYNHLVRLNNLFDRYINILNTETSLINYRNRRIYEHTYQMSSYTTHTYYYTTNTPDYNTYTNNIMRSHTYISNITYRIQPQPINVNIRESNNIHNKKRIKKLNIKYYNQLNNNNKNRVIKQNYKKHNYKKQYYNKNIKNKNYNYLR